MLSYITARTARNRLNKALGPENWSCKVEASDKWVKCAITISLPDGNSITREAIGGYPDMPNEEDRVKGGDSDAFKRCCALFGIGEYLYGDDDSHDHVRNEATGRTPSLPDGGYPPTKQQVSNWYDKSRDVKNQQPSPSQSRGWPRHGRQLFPWLKGIEKDYQWPTVVAEVNENFGPGSNYSFPGKITEWDEEQANAAATFVAHECSKTGTYKGEFDKMLGAKQ